MRRKRNSVVQYVIIVVLWIVIWNLFRHRREIICRPKTAGHISKRTGGDESHLAEALPIFDHQRVLPALDKSLPKSSDNSVQVLDKHFPESNGGLHNLGKVLIALGNNINEQYLDEKHLAAGKGAPTHVRYERMLNDSVDGHEKDSKDAKTRLTINVDSKKRSVPVTAISAKPKASTTCYRQVQIWTDENQWQSGVDVDCPGLPCKLRQVADNSSETMSKSHAVIFHQASAWSWEDVHRRKPPGQKWIFTTAESPLNTRRTLIPPKRYYSSSYDYIMSYRRHVDNIFGDFGRFDRSRPAVDPSAKHDWTRGRTRLAAWIARNCEGEYLHWNRTGFVRALSRIVDVSMYGPCGSEQCVRYSPECLQKLRSHKFYLAFENSRCRNYITEKVWSNAFDNNLVPVVFGPPKQDYELVLPPNSFIFLEDFKSMRELADYLLLLDKRDDLYVKYHSWRTTGRTESVEEGQLLNPPQMCNVVERLLRDEAAVAAGTYRPVPAPDWDKWWWGSCDAIKPFPIPLT